MLLLDYLKSNAIDAARHSVLIASLAVGIDELRAQRKQQEKEKAEKEKADEVASLKAKLDAAMAKPVNVNNEE